MSSEAPSPQKAISISSRTVVTVEDSGNANNGDASTADGFEFTIDHKPVGKSWKLRAKTDRARRIWIRALSLAGAQVPPEFAADDAEAAEYRALTSEYLTELNNQSERGTSPGHNAVSLAERQRIEAEVEREDGVKLDSGRRETRMQRSLTSLLINSHAGKSLQQSGRESKAAAVLPFACANCQPAARFPTQMQLDAHIRSVHTAQGEQQKQPLKSPSSPRLQQTTQATTTTTAAATQVQPTRPLSPGPATAAMPTRPVSPGPAAAVAPSPARPLSPGPPATAVAQSPARPLSPGPTRAMPASPARASSSRPVPATPTRPLSPATRQSQPAQARPVSSTALPVPASTAPAPPRPQTPPAPTAPPLLTMSPDPSDFSDRDVPPAPDSPPPKTPPLQPPSTPGSIRYDANGVAVMKVPQRFVGAMSARGPPQSPGRLAGAPVPRGALNIFAVDDVPLPEPSEPPPPSPPPSEPSSTRERLLTSNVNYGLPMADDDFERSDD
jgi:hypothetical protein